MFSREMLISVATAALSGGGLNCAMAVQRLRKRFGENLWVVSKSESGRDALKMTNRRV
jgi:hypothetical protein